MSKEAYNVNFHLNNKSWEEIHKRKGNYKFLENNHMYIQ